MRVSLRSGDRAVTLAPRRQPRPDRAAADGQGRRARRRRLDHRARSRDRSRSACWSTSRRLPTRIRVYRTDLGQAAGGGRAHAAARRRARASGTGTANGAPAPPGTYQIVAFVRDQAGNVGRSAPVEPGPTARAARRERARAARPSRRPTRCRPGETATFAVDSRGRPFRWRIFRVGERAARGEGPRARPAAGSSVTVPGGASGVYVLQGRDRPPLDRGPVRGPGRRRRADPRRPARGDLVRPRHARRRPRRLAEHARQRQPRRLPAAPAGRACPRASPTTSRALLAFLDEQKIRYDVTTDLTLAATAHRRCPASARACCSPARCAGSPTTSRAGCGATSTSGGLVASFGTGHAAPRGRRSRATGCCARSRRATPTRSARGCARCARSTSGDPLQPTADEGDTGLLTGVGPAPGHTEVEESDPSRAGRVRVALAAVDPQAFERGRDVGRAAAGELPGAHADRGGARAGDPRRAARSGAPGSARAPSRSSS